MGIYTNSITRIRSSMFNTTFWSLGLARIRKIRSAINTNGRTKLNIRTAGGGKESCSAFCRRMDVAAYTPTKINPFIANPSFSQPGGRMALSRTKNPVMTRLSSNAAAII